MKWADDAEWKVRGNSASAAQLCLAAISWRTIDLDRVEAGDIGSGNGVPATYCVI